MWKLSRTSISLLLPCQQHELTSCEWEARIHHVSSCPHPAKFSFPPSCFVAAVCVLCVGKVTVSVCVCVCHTLPQFFLFVEFCPSCTNCCPQCSNNAAPKTSAGTNENQINQIRALLFYHVHISAHMCTYKYVECAHVLQHASPGNLRLSHHVQIQLPPTHACSNRMNKNVPQVRWYSATGRQGASFHSRL